MSRARGVRLSVHFDLPKNGGAIKAWEKSYDFGHDDEVAITFANCEMFVVGGNMVIKVPVEAITTSSTQTVGEKGWWTDG